MLYWRSEAGRKPPAASFLTVAAGAVVETRAFSCAAAFFLASRAGLRSRAWRPRSFPCAGRPCAGLLLLPGPVGRIRLPSQGDPDLGSGRGPAGAACHGAPLIEERGQVESVDELPNGPRVRCGSPPVCQGQGWHKDLPISTAPARVGLGSSGQGRGVIRREGERWIGGRYRHRRLRAIGVHTSRIDTKISLSCRAAGLFHKL